MFLAFKNVRIAIFLNFASFAQISQLSGGVRQEIGSGPRKNIVWYNFFRHRTILEKIYSAKFYLETI